MRNLFLAAAVAGTAFVAGQAGAETAYVHPFAYPQPEDTAEFFTVIEIPAGSVTKYEVDADTGHVLVDRYMAMPVVYPGNYGSIASSLGGDGDPLDALVLSREAIVPGALIRVRAIGVLHMIDGGEADDKIIAVPVSAVDRHWDAVASVEDLPVSEIDRIEAFFRVYKDLPVGSKIVELNGYSGADAAAALVGEAIAAYRAAQ